MKNIINSINKIEFCYRANKKSTSAEFEFYLQNFCSTGRNTKSNKTKKKKTWKKKRLNILRVKIKDFIVPFLKVQSIMCTLTRVNNQRS